MKSVVTILLKIFSVEFYKLNAAFFLMTGGLLFGFMSSVEHKALAQLFISSPMLLAIPVSCWIFYTGKVVIFNKGVIQLQQNEFVYQLSLLDLPGQCLFIIVVITSQLLPVILYGAFLIGMAISTGIYSSAVYCIIVILALVITGISALIHQLNNPNQKKEVSAIKAFFDKSFKKTYYQFCIEWIARKDLTSLTGSKIFSCLLLYGVLTLYKAENYDERLLGMGISIIFLSNASIVFGIHEFENIHFSILRNLPLRLWIRLMNFIIVYFILCLPEISLIIRDFPTYLSIVSMVSALVFSVGSGILYYGYLYRRHTAMEHYMRFVFFSMIISILLILFGVPYGVLAGIYLVTGTYLFQKYYYDFEIIASSNS